MSKVLAILITILCLFNGVNAYADHRFGVEFELAMKSKESPEKLSRKILLETHKILGGDESNFNFSKQKWSKHPETNLDSYSYKDFQGRTWEVVPEVVNSDTYDGLEFVTPPLEKSEVSILQKIVVALKKIKSLKPGTLSSGHITLEVSHLISGNDYRKVTNLILYIESHWPEIYAYIAPKRIGHMVNFYAVPMAMDQASLLKKISEIPEAERTYENLRKIFKEFHSHEVQLRDADGFSMYPWKFRAANYAKLFALAKNKQIPVIEFRATDLDLTNKLSEKIEMLLSLFDQDYSKKVAFEDRFGKALRWFEGEEAMIDKFSENKFLEMSRRMNMGPEKANGIVQRVRSQKERERLLQDWYQFDEKQLPKDLTFDIEISLHKNAFRRLSSEGILSRWPNFIRDNNRIYLKNPLSLSELKKINDLLIKPFGNSVQEINLNIYDSRQDSTFSAMAEQSLKWMLADAAASAEQSVKHFQIYSHEQTRKSQATRFSILGNHSDLISFILGITANNQVLGQAQSPLLKKYSLADLVDTYAHANNMRPLAHHERRFLSEIERSMPAEFLLPLSNITDGRELTRTEKTRIEKATQEFILALYNDITSIGPDDLDFKNGRSFIRGLNNVWVTETEHSKMIASKYILQQPRSYRCEHIFTGLN